MKRPGILSWLFPWRLAFRLWSRVQHLQNELALARKQVDEAQGLMRAVAKSLEKQGAS